MRISDWSSDVCSSDLIVSVARAVNVRVVTRLRFVLDVRGVDGNAARLLFGRCVDLVVALGFARAKCLGQYRCDCRRKCRLAVVTVPDRTSVYVRFGPFQLTFRSEAHTSELQSLLRISYAVFCLNTKPYSHLSPSLTIYISLL